MADEMNPDDDFIAIPWTASKEELTVKKKRIEIENKTRPIRRTPRDVSYNIKGKLHLIQKLFYCIFLLYKNLGQRDASTLHHWIEPARGHEILSAIF